MSQVYTQVELEELPPMGVIDIVLVQQDQHEESRDIAVKEIQELQDMVDGLQKNLLDTAKQLERSAAMGEHASKFIEMMEAEIAGFTAGVFRRDQMISAMKNQIAEFHKKGKGA